VRPEKVTKTLVRKTEKKYRAKDLPFKRRQAAFQPPLRMKFFYLEEESMRESRAPLLRKSGDETGGKRSVSRNEKPVSRTVPRLIQRNEKPVRGELLSIDEAAQYIHLGKTSLYKCIKNGDISFFRPPKGKILLDTAVLDEWLRNSLVPAGTVPGNI